jgi:hypothetical protein
VAGESNGHSVISAHPDALRNVASQLEALDTDSVVRAVKDLQDTLRAEASKNTVDGSPSGIFQPLQDAFDGVCKKITDNIDQFSQNVTGDAQTLRTMADNITAHEHEHAARVANL